MTPTDRRLEAIVALKRQRAEQRVAALKRDLDRLDRDIAALVAKLSTLDASDVQFDVRQFVEEHGFVQHLMLQTQQRFLGRAEVLADLEVAEQALRQVIYSEGRVGDRSEPRR